MSSNIKWRMAARVKCFIGEDNRIYLADASIAKYLNTVRKFIKSDVVCVETDNTSANWKLKLQKNGVLLVKSDKLPDPNEWYIIGNFNQESLFCIIGSVSMTNGEIQDTFEFVFSDETPYQCFAVCKNMPEWKKSMEELRRSLIISYSSKTSKFIPGNIYDLPNKSIVYLGSSGTHLPNHNFNASVTDAVGSIMAHYYIYTDEILDNETKVSDIFNNHGIGSNIGDIKISYKMETMVDSGPRLTDDWSALDDITKLETIINKWTKDNKNVVNNHTYYYNLESLIDALINTSLAYPVKNDTIKNLITDIITNNFKLYIEYSFNLRNLSGNYDINEITTSTIKDYFYNLRMVRVNYSSIATIIIVLFGYYGISISDISKPVNAILTNFIKNYPQYDSNLKIYQEHEGFFKNRYFENYNFLIDIRYEDRTHIDRYIKIEEVRNLIIAIHEENNKTNGKFSEDYKIKNEGSVKNPYNCCWDLINLQNILDYTKNNLNPEVENWILSNKIFKILILDKYNG